jgi:signal transduction histidine kinase
VKFSPNGKILVRQEIVSHDAKKFVRISVQDNGIGIAKEDIRRLFAKFLRSTEAKKVDATGLGLGLFFVKKVVEDHGGKCQTESEGLGKGSTFIVEIPFQE